MQVHHDDVRAQLLRERDGFVCRPRLADDLGVGFALEDRADPGSEDGVIVGDKDPDGFQTFRPSGKTAVTRVPPPGCSSTTPWPPTSAGRSRIDVIPSPEGAPGTIPFPSSST